MQRSGKTQSSLKCLSESFVYFFFNQILKYLKTVSVKTKQVGTGNSSELNTLFAGGSGSFITNVLSARKSQSRVPSHGCFIVTANWNSEKLWLASSSFFFFPVEASLQQSARPLGPLTHRVDASGTPP